MSAFGLVAAILFWSSALLLGYVYWGYGVVLGLFARFGSAPPAPRRFDDKAWPLVTILLTVHNEEQHIERRLANLAAQDYPPDRIELIVASDGSTDRTEAMVEAFAGDLPVKLLRTGRVGKSAAQNAAISAAQGEIVVLTDAGGSFDPACVREFAAAFADPQVGCATAHLRPLERSGAVAASQSLYWSYELKLRALESRLGILAIASGTAMALRRVLFRELPAQVGDDCIIPLDVVMQGYRVMHCRAALAYDAFEHEAAREFWSRVRMTMRNWTGTWMVPALLDPFRHPGYAFALWSHKLLRWLGSIGLLVMTASAIAMAATDTQRPAAVAFGAFLTAGALGWWTARDGRSIPLAGTVYAFLLANAGFLVGTCKAVSGHRAVAYRSGVRSPHAAGSTPED